MSNPFVRIWPALKDVDLVPVPAKLQQSGSGSGQNFLGPKIYQILAWFHRGNQWAVGVRDMGPSLSWV